MKAKQVSGKGVNRFTGTFNTKKITSSVGLFYFHKYFSNFFNFFNSIQLGKFTRNKRKIVYL
ncbi:MAG: hypothetical protein PWQ53_1258 [Bacteroidota bacterium]|nr:hypothetical protein [Methermicoccus sp.]MDK2969695.1 hypothetical protein [Bacteroidota bacterium]MDN5306599.1 hypothetical protein [Bacteroidota bacterium]PLB85539.1 hypothetical protein C0T31_10350 [Dysgonamonadaceae bacterium]